MAWRTGERQATALLTFLRTSLFPRLTAAWVTTAEGLPLVARVAAAEILARLELAESAGTRPRPAELGALEQEVAVVLAES